MFFYKHQFCVKAYGSVSSLPDHRRPSLPVGRCQATTTNNDAANTTDISDVPKNANQEYCEGIPPDSEGLKNLDSMPSAALQSECKTNIIENNVSSDPINDRNAGEAVDESILGLWFNLLISDARGRLAAVRRSKGRCQKMGKADVISSNTKDCQQNTENAGVVPNEPCMNGHYHELAAIGAASTRLFNEMESTLLTEEEELENHIEHLQTIFNNTVGNVVLDSTIDIEENDKEQNNKVNKNNAFIIKSTKDSLEAASSVQNTLRSIVSSAIQTSSRTDASTVTEGFDKNLYSQRVKRTRRDRIGQYTYVDYLELLGYDSMT